MRLAKNTFKRAYEALELLVGGSEGKVTVRLENTIPYIQISFFPEPDEVGHAVLRAVNLTGNKLESQEKFGDRRAVATESEDLRIVLFLHEDTPEEGCFND